MSKNKLFIIFSILLLIWIFIGNINYQGNLSWLKTILLVFFALIFAILAYLIHKKRNIFFVLIIVLWFLAWIFISYINTNNILLKEKILEDYFDNSKHKITFEILDTHKIKDFENEYIAKVKSINNFIINKKIHSIIIIPSNFKLDKWYVIESEIKLQKLKNSPEFSYKNYMLSKNIFFKAYLNIFSTKLIKKRNFIEKYIWKIRKKSLETIEKIYPKEEWIFLWWILIWARENLPSSLKRDFNNSWLTHFIAVSGFNITILIVFLTYLLKYFPTSVKIITITVSIFLFTVLVWDTAPVVRASIMWLIWYYVLVSWRDWNALSVMLLTAIIMVILSPLSINYDVSLHLSFLAVLWIMYTQNFFSKIFYFLPEVLEIRIAFVLTLSALSFTLPIMIFNFWQISLMSPFANIAVSWTIPIAMSLWFLSILVYFIYPLLWVIVWYLTWIFLKWDILVVHFFWQLDWAILQVDFWIYKNHIQILYFAVLIFLIFWFRKDVKDCKI